MYRNDEPIESLVELITQLQSTPEPTVTQKIKGPLFRLFLRGLRPFIEIQAKVNPIVKLLFGFHSSVID
jgi:hypothetical protein